MLHRTSHRALFFTVYYCKLRCRTPSFSYLRSETRKKIFLLYINCPVHTLKYIRYVKSTFSFCFIQKKASPNYLRINSFAAKYCEINQFLPLSTSRKRCFGGKKNVANPETVDLTIKQYRLSVSNRRIFKM